MKKFPDALATFLVLAQVLAASQVASAQIAESDTSDRRAGDRRSSDRRNAERRTSSRRSSDRSTPDRRATDRRSGDRRSGDRRTTERRTEERRAANSPAELHSELHSHANAPHDPFMHERNGRLVCEIPRLLEPKRTLPMGIIPEIPILNSRPEATAVLYLDYDGEVVTDSAWNNGVTINALSFGIPASEIAEVVGRVGDDYAPFNINVTTDERRYWAAPVGKRMRVIITPTDTVARFAGGVAYLDSFAQAGKMDLSDSIPAWVFNYSVLGICEAVSHELGHTLGLDHDGRTIPDEEYYFGNGPNYAPDSWAPIMGVSYKRTVTHWSKGDYLNANRFEDDVAILSGPVNGFGYASDEAGGTIATAAPLAFSSPGAVLQRGVITQSSDADYFSFSTAGGAVSLAASTPGSTKPNLDILLEIRNGAGEVVASNNEPVVLNAAIATNLTPGNYVVTVRGMGAGDGGQTNGYTAYGSLGAYTITGTLPSAAPSSRLYTWNGGDGNWNDASKWTPNGVPQAAGDTATFPSGTGTISLGQMVSPDAVTVDAGANYGFSGAGGISGGTGVVANGTMKLVNSNSYSGVTTVGPSGAVFIGNATASGTVQSASINNSGTLYLGRTDATTLPNIISGTGNVNQVSSGTTTLSGDNSYTGKTSVSSGTLRFAVGNFTEEIGALQIESGAAINVVFANNTAPGALSFADSSAQSWNGSLTVNNFRGSNTQLFIGTTQSLSPAQLSRIRFVNPNNSTGNFAATQLSTGEIKPLFAPGASSGAIISEFRFRGPGGGADEFVEIYNALTTPLNVGGWAIRTNTATGLKTTAILEGTIIKARGHLLFTGGGYSLGSYGGGDVAIADDILDDSGVTLLNAAGEVQDAVGFTSSQSGQKEGSGVSASPSAQDNVEHSWMRDFNVSVPKNTAPDSSQDFLADTPSGTLAAGTAGSAAPRLGAPSPEGLSSPLYSNATITTLLLDPNFDQNAAPNRVRTGAVNQGTILVRRTLVNKTGKALQRVRLSVTRITSLGSPVLPGNTAANQADVRLISSSDEPNVPMTGGTINVFGTRLEAGASGLPAQPLGGGIGSSLEFDAFLNTPLLHGQSRSYSFLLQVVKSGNFTIAFNIKTVLAP